MKRLLSKNFKNRVIYDNIKTKIYRYLYLNDEYPLFGFSKIYNMCIFSCYSKLVFREYHISSKFLKFFFRYGLIYGIRKKSF